MLIKQVVIENAEKLQDVRVTDGKFAAIDDFLTPIAGEQVIDATGKLMIPPSIHE